MDQLASRSARSAQLSSPPIHTEKVGTILIGYGSTRSPGSGGGSRPSGHAQLDPMARLILASFNCSPMSSECGHREVEWFQMCGCSFGQCRVCGERRAWHRWERPIGSTVPGPATATTVVTQGQRETSPAGAVDSMHGAESGRP